MIKEVSKLPDKTLFILPIELLGQQLDILLQEICEELDILYPEEIFVEELIAFDEYYFKVDEDKYIHVIFNEEE